MTSYYVYNECEKNTDCINFLYYLFGFHKYGFITHNTHYKIFSKKVKAHKRLMFTLPFWAWLWGCLPQRKRGNGRLLVSFTVASSRFNRRTKKNPFLWGLYYDFMRLFSMPCLRQNSLIKMLLRPLSHLR